MQYRPCNGALKTRVDCVARVGKLSVEMCKNVRYPRVRQHEVVEPSRAPWGAFIFPNEGTDAGFGYHWEMVGQGVVDDTGS